MAKLRHDLAIWGDGLSFLGQALLMWLLRDRLSLEGVLLVMAATSTAAALVQGSQLGLESFTIRSAVATLREFVSLGRWVLLSSLTGLFTTQAYPWAIALFRGAPTLAGFQALANIIRVSHPVLLSTGGIVVPAVARARALGGWPRAWGIAVRHAATGAGLLFPYFLLIMIFPHQILRLMYGADSPYLALETVLRVYAFGYSFLYVCEVAGAFLGGLGQSRGNFVAQVVQSLIYLGIGLPLIVRFGVLGAAWGGLAAVVARFVVLGIYIRKSAAALP